MPQLGSHQDCNHASHTTTCWRSRQRIHLDLVIKLKKSHLILCLRGPDRFYLLIPFFSSITPNTLITYKPSEEKTNNQRQHRWINSGYDKQTPNFESISIWRTRSKLVFFPRRNPTTQTIKIIYQLTSDKSIKQPRPDS